jgi:anthraniloyl-CoA monooxygenase
MTRAGKVSLDRFAVTAPEVVRRAVAQFADCAAGDVPATALVDWVLDRKSAEPGELPMVYVDVDDPWGAAADALIKDVDATAVLLTSADDRESVLTMLDVAERIRRETATRVHVLVPEVERELGAAALVSGRADVVRLRNEAG